MTGWMDELRALPVVAVARAFNYHAGNREIGPCPSCQEKQRSKGDRRWAVGINDSGTGWQCWACKATGDAIAFAAFAAVGAIPGKGSPLWRELHARCLDVGLVVGLQPHEIATPEPPSAPKRLDPAEVQALWDQCLPVDQVDLDDTAAGFLVARQYGPPNALAALDVVRVMPTHIRTPWWWPQSWRESWRLVIRAHDANGVVVGMHARAVDDATPKTRWGMTAKKKGEPALAEYRQSLFLGVRGHDLLAGQVPDDVVVWVGEGLTSCVNASLQLASRPRSVVVTAASGGFAALGSLKWPANATVFIGTDDVDKDGTGNRYAAQILRTLPAHVRCFRVRWNPSGSGSMDMGNATMQDFVNAAKAAVDMRDSAEPASEAQPDAPNAPEPEADAAVERLKTLLASLIIAQDDIERRKLWADWLRGRGPVHAKLAYAGRERTEIEALLVELGSFRGLRSEVKGLKAQIHGRSTVSRDKTEDVEVEIVKDLVDMTTRGLELLETHGNIYQQGGRLVQVGRDPKLGPVVRPLTIDGIRTALAQTATWVSVVKRGDDLERVPDLPPEWLSRSIISQPQWGFSYLEGIMRSPTVRPDGSVLSKGGFDAQTGLFLDTGGVDIDVPDSLGLTDAEAAIDALFDLVEDVPFERPHHRSAWLAALFTVLARPAIDGPCPLFMVNASTPGTGKTTLADIIGVIASGEDLPHQAYTDDDNEMRKRITAIASFGVPVVLFDNVDGVLGGSSLDSVLTSTTWSDRELATSRMITAPMRTVWLASGNNIQIKGDIARRIIPISLSIDMERPEERVRKFPQIKDHIRAHRTRYITAVLTVLRAYILQGRPRMVQAAGFPEWSALIRNCLVWAGQPDPYDGVEQLRGEGDSRANEAIQLLRAWHRCFGAQWVSLQDVDRQLQWYRTNDPTQLIGDKRDQLYDTLREDPKLWDRDRLLTKSVGYRLRRIKNRVFGGFKLQSRVDTVRNAHEWLVVKCG